MKLELHLQVEIKTPKLISFCRIEDKVCNCLWACDENLYTLLQLLPAREAADDLPVLCDHQRVPGVGVVRMEPLLKNVPWHGIPKRHSCKNTDHQKVSYWQWEGVSRTWGKRTLCVSRRCSCPLCHVSKYRTAAPATQSTQMACLFTCLISTD